MWKFLVILSCCAVAQSCRVIEQKANGVEQTREAFSSHVLLETFLDYELKYLCSGVLISADYVLTTARCVFGNVFVNVHVYPYKLRDEFEEGREIYRSKNVVMHPEFDGFKNVHDVAIVKLPSTLKVNERPYNFATLPTSAPTVGASGMGVGWGLFDFKDDNAASMTHARSMTIASEAECSAAYPVIWGSDAAGRGCVVGTGMNCVGDSGAPWFVGDVVHGLLSFGAEEACSTAAFPNGIQVVHEHIDWIRSVIDTL